MRGQVATEAKSSAITAIPQLHALLHLEGRVLTIDAMGCQTRIAAQIIAQGGDDLLALQGNQGTLEREVEEAFIDADARGTTRGSTRRCWGPSSAATGAFRMRCIGASVWLFARMTRACATPRPVRAWRCCATSRSRAELQGLIPACSLTPIG